MKENREFRAWSRSTQFALNLTGHGIHRLLEIHKWIEEMKATHPKAKERFDCGVYSPMVASYLSRRGLIARSGRPGLYDHHYLTDEGEIVCQLLLAAGFSWEPRRQRQIEASNPDFASWTRATRFDISLHGPAINHLLYMWGSENFDPGLDPEDYGLQIFERSLVSYLTRRGLIRRTARNQNIHNFLLTEEGKLVCKLLLAAGFKTTIGVYAEYA